MLQLHVVTSFQCASALLALGRRNFGSSHSGLTHQRSDGFGGLTTHLSCLDATFTRTWYLLLAHLSWVTEELAPGATMSYMLDSSNTELKTSTNISSTWIIQLFHQLVSNPNVHNLHPNNLSTRVFCLVWRIYGPLQNHCSRTWRKENQHMRKH